MPIIKCSIKPVGQAQSYRTDISLGVDNGVKAVALIQSYMKAFAPLHPLVIVIKSLLKVSWDQRVNFLTENDALY